MKMALTVWENRISPVADSSRKLLVVRLARQTVAERRIENFDYESLFDRAGKLYDLGIDTLICGAISSFFASLVEGYGICVISFVCGETDAVLNAFLTESLRDAGCIMKGSCAY